MVSRDPGRCGRFKRMLDFTRENVGNRMAVVYIEKKIGRPRKPWKT